jgi:CheY-like chemotaxis protein
VSALGARAREEVRRTIEHDLKTPLAVIMGYAELLRDRTDDRTRDEAAVRILESAERLRSEIDGLAGRISNLDTTAEAALEPRRILLVEDDDDLRRLLQATCAVSNFELFEAADGDRALELVEECEPELLVLDWQLPGRSGREVLSELKRRNIPARVIVLTADPGAAEDAAEADAFLTKPFSPVELLWEIDRLLEA